MQVLNFLRKSRITETMLDVEHVEMLLGVLVLDGEVERVSHCALPQLSIPAYLMLW